MKHELDRRQFVPDQLVWLDYIGTGDYVMRNIDVIKLCTLAGVPVNTFHVSKCAELIDKARVNLAHTLFKL